MIIVTGNAGFIGRYLTTSLLANGCEVHGIDIRPRTDVEKGFYQYEGNILKNNEIRSAMAGAESVIHLAAAHKDFGITKSQYDTINEHGTRIVLEEATKANIEKIVFYSSVSVYGAQSNTTEDTPPVPNTPYGASKLAAERLVCAWAQEYPTRTAIIIRPTVVFGPRNQANIFRLIRQVCDGRFLMVGRGDNIKSIAFVRNVVDATVYLLGKCDHGVHIFNYADEPHRTTRELTALIALLSNRKLPQWYIPVHIAELGGVVFDVAGKLTGIDFPITAARMKKFSVSTYHRAERIRQFGFVPKYSIEEGLKENIDWYRAQV